MTEKYLLLPKNPQQLTPAQTALQRMSEKHHDFEIQAVNTIRPPDIKYTRTSQPLVPVDTPLLDIPRQSDIDKRFKKYRNMSDTWTRIINPGTRSCKSLSNINAFSRHLSLHNRQKITIWH